MSHLNTQLACQCGQLVEPESPSSSSVQCPKCKKMLSLGPEPTLEELGAALVLARKQLVYYETISRPREYNALVDLSLAKITAEKVYLDRLQDNLLHAPERMEQIADELEHLQEQFNTLVQRKAAQTRGKGSHTGVKSKPSFETKLRGKIGDALFDRLLKELGSVEAIEAAWKV